MYGVKYCIVAIGCVNIYVILSWQDDRWQYLKLMQGISTRAGALFCTSGKDRDEQKYEEHINKTHGRYPHASLNNSDSDAQG